jgi:hypothetical protein
MSQAVTLLTAYRMTLLDVGLDIRDLCFQGGKTPAHSLFVLVPEAFRGQPLFDDTPEIVEMMEYYEGLQATPF